MKGFTRGFLCLLLVALLSDSLDFSIDIASWTAEQIGTWLLSVGLQKYIEAFESGSVDGSKLQALDQPQLEFLGVKGSDATKFMTYREQLCTCPSWYFNLFLNHCIYDD